LLAAVISSLFAARFLGRNGSEIGWKVFCRKRFDIHLDQTDKWASKGRFRLAAAIDDYPDRCNNRAMCLNNIERLLNVPGASRRFRQ
jgi:hypothetical protein